ncbi:MAG: phytanoyl-CoA dioxygenase family protein [Candidatus Latescibacterota bacterium]
MRNSFITIKEMGMSLTDAELNTYQDEGAVIIDTPFTSEELDKAEAAWDRLTTNGAPPYEDPDYVNLVQHPYLEAVAKKVLKAQAVHLWGGVRPHERAPSKGPFGSARERWEKGYHTDIQATWEDFNATPRRMRAELWLWVNDVPIDRGAMRILPGSHKPIMEHWSRVLTPEHKAELPRVHGLRPDPTEKSLAYPECVPQLSDTLWADQEPVPQVARRGQMLILCSAGLHSAWENEDVVPRKAMTTSWVANGVKCGLPKNQRDGVLSFFPELRKKLRPERKHIVPENFDWLFESDYEPKWPETFATK